MKYLIDKTSYTKEDVLGHIRIIGTGLSLIDKKGSLSTFINGSKVFEMNNDTDVDHVLIPVVANLVSNLYYKTPEHITIYKNEWSKESSEDILNKVVESTSKIIGNENISIKTKAKEDRNIVAYVIPSFTATAINPDHLRKNLSVLSNKIDNSNKILQACMDDSQMLTRKKLVNSMWGAKDTQSFLDGVKNKMSNNLENINKIELYKELISKSINRVNSKLSFNVSQEDKNILINVLIPEIMSNFQKLKELFFKSIAIIAPLICANDVFHKNTGYPSNWFMSDDTVDNLKEKYASLINFLTEIPAIDNKVIYPLDFYKMSIEHEE